MQSRLEDHDMPCTVNLTQSHQCSAGLVVRAHSMCCRSSSGLGRSSDALDGQGNAFTGAQAQVPSAMAMPAVNGSAALQDGDGLGDAVLPGRDSIAHPFEVRHVALRPMLSSEQYMATASCAPAA